MYAITIFRGDNMSRQKVKDTKEWIKQKEMFSKNIFYLFEVIQKIRMDKSINIAHKARMLGEYRETINNWIGKGVDSLPTKGKQEIILFKILNELNATDIPVKAMDLTTVNIETKYGQYFDKLILDNEETKDVLQLVRGAQASFIPYALQMFLKSDDAVVYSPNKEEINILAQVKFPPEFQTSPELYKALLVLYRKKQ